MSPNQAVVHSHINHSRARSPFPDDPLASALGASLVQADAQAGIVMLEFEPGGMFLQGEGVVQGGGVSAMLDFATACATMAVMLGGHECATITLTCSFLRPVPLGVLQVWAEIEKRGRTTVFARASIALASHPDRVLATANAVLAVRGETREK